MNVRIIHSACVLIMVSALMGFRADDTYSLKQKYNKDDVATYQMSFGITTDEGDISFSTKNRFKVLSVDEDGAYEMEETMLGGTLKAGGEEQAMEAEDPKIRKYDKDGKEIKENKDDEEEEDPVSKVVDDVLSFEPDHAVKIGETWDREGDYGTIHAKLEGKEKLGDVDCLKITVKSTLSKKDASGEVSATFFVRESNFTPEKVEATMENANLGEGVVMKKIEMKMERIAD